LLIATLRYYPCLGMAPEAEAKGCSAILQLNMLKKKLSTKKEALFLAPSVFCHGFVAKTLFRQLLVGIFARSEFLKLARKLRHSRPLSARRFDEHLIMKLSLFFYCFLLFIDVMDPGAGNAVLLADTAYPGQVFLPAGF